jgi:hypothetical protein
MIRRIIRWAYRKSVGRSIQPMPKGSLLTRCAVLGEWITDAPKGAMR